MATTVSNPVSNFFDGLAHHTRALLATLVILGVVGAGVAFFLNHREAQTTQGRDAYYRARQVYDKELAVLSAGDSRATSAASSNAPKAIDAAKAAETAKTADAKKASTPQDASKAESYAFRKLDVDSKLPDAVKAYTAVASGFDGTRPAFDARLALGDLYFDHGSSDKALGWYKKAVETAPGKFEKLLSTYALGYAKENSGKPAEALQDYDHALALGDSGLKGDLLLAVARCYEQTHDTAKARSAYDQVISQLPNSQYSKSAEIAKALLE